MTIEERLGSIPLETPSTNPKELFDIKEIEGKTELTAEQVIIISRLKVMGDYLKKHHNIDTINKFIKNFLTLQLSKDRKSREEFVSSFQSKNDERNASFMDRFSLSLGGKK